MVHSIASRVAKQAARNKKMGVPSKPKLRFHYSFNKEELDYILELQERSTEEVQVFVKKQTKIIYSAIGSMPTSKLHPYYCMLIRVYNKILSGDCSLNIITKLHTIGKRFVLYPKVDLDIKKWTKQLAAVYPGSRHSPFSSIDSLAYQASRGPNVSPDLLEQYKMLTFPSFSDAMIENGCTEALFAAIYKKDRGSPIHRMTLDAMDLVIRHIQ